METEYDIKAIWELVDAALNDDDLNTISYLHFNKVHDNTPGRTRPQKILSLVDYAVRQGFENKLLEEIRKQNPHQYGQFESRLKKRAVTSPNSEKKAWYEIRLNFKINDIHMSLIRSILEFLWKTSKDFSITVKEIEPGSVKLFLEGSLEGFKTLASLITDGKLETVLDIPVESIELVEIIYPEAVPEAPRKSRRWLDRVFTGTENLVTETFERFIAPLGFPVRELARPMAMGTHDAGLAYNCLPVPMDFPKQGGPATILSSDANKKLQNSIAKLFDSGTRFYCRTFVFGNCHNLIRTGEKREFLGKGDNAHTEDLPPETGLVVVAVCPETELDTITESVSEEKTYNIARNKVFWIVYGPSKEDLGGAES